MSAPAEGGLKVEMILRALGAVIVTSKAAVPSLAEGDRLGGHRVAEVDFPKTAADGSPDRSMLWVRFVDPAVTEAMRIGQVLPVG